MPATRTRSKKSALRSKGKTGRTKARTGVQEKRVGMIPSSGEYFSIPVFRPLPLPDGLHVAPYRSWTGAVLLIVIRDGKDREGPYNISGVTGGIFRGSKDVAPRDPNYLAGFHRAWERGVYLDPNSSDERYMAIDAHGRHILTAVVGVWSAGHSPAEYTGETAIEACRSAILAEDRIIRKRVRGAPGWI